MSTADVIQHMTTELVAAGAAAVVLTGSQARGDASRQSDIDLYAIGAGPHYQLAMHKGELVSVSWRTRETIEESFLSPSMAGAAVPGWRSAVILHDPHSVAEQLVSQAHRWTWDDIGDERINALVAEELTGLAEEVFKLVALLEQRKFQAASVQRSILALRVPIVMATHLRLLYDSENVLWDLVAEGMGPEWSQVQANALGLLDRPVTETCHAALVLFALACEAAAPLFNARQQAVVDATFRHIRAARPVIHRNLVVVTLVERDGRFLIIEELNADGIPAWNFPAGGVEAGESITQAAIREVREETGWEVEPTHLLRVDHGYFAGIPALPWWRHVVVARPCPEATPSAPEPTILNVEWLAPEELAGRTLRSPDAGSLIADYLHNGPGLDLSRYRFAQDGKLAGYYH